MRRILTVILISLVYVSLQAQLISFDALKDGVIDVATIEKELILKGFTQATNSSASSVDTYVYGYDEKEETANIRVKIKAIMEFKSAGLYSIDILTSGDYVHDELVEEITENCTFERIHVGNEIYTCDHATFVVSSQGGNRIIAAYPDFEQLAEEMTEEELEEFMNAIEEMNEEK